MRLYARQPVWLALLSIPCACIAAFNCSNWPLTLVRSCISIFNCSNCPLTLIRSCSACALMLISDLRLLLLVRACMRPLTRELCFRVRLLSLMHSWPCEWDWQVGASSVPANSFRSMVWHPEKVGEPAAAHGVSECFPVSLRCGVHVLVRAPSLFRCWPCVLLPRCLPRPLFGDGLGRATAWRLCSVHCYGLC